MELTQNGKSLLRLAKNLEYLLKEHDMTAAQLSRKSGVAKQVISDWLSGCKPRNIEQVKNVADVFKISIDQICFVTSEGIFKPKNQPADVPSDWQSGIYEIRFRKIKA